MNFLVTPYDIKLLQIKSTGGTGNLWYKLLCHSRSSKLTFHKRHPYQNSVRILSPHQVLATCQAYDSLQHSTS
jgi:hypothetical protein